MACSEKVFIFANFCQIYHFMRCLVIEKVLIGSCNLAAHHHYNLHRLNGEGLYINLSKYPSVPCSSLSSFIKKSWVRFLKRHCVKKCLHHNVGFLSVMFFSCLSRSEHYSSVSTVDFEQVDIIAKCREKKFGSIVSSWIKTDGGGINIVNVCYWKCQQLFGLGSSNKTENLICQCFSF